VLGRPVVEASVGEEGAATDTDGIEGGVGSDGGLADGTDGLLGSEGMETDTGICIAGAAAGGGGVGDGAAGLLTGP
jgi:hypothetical protein